MFAYHFFSASTVQQIHLLVYKWQMIKLWAIIFAAREAFTHPNIFIFTDRFQGSLLGRQICRNGDPSRQRWAAATQATRASAEPERNFRRGASNTELRHSSDFAQMLKAFIYWTAANSQLFFNKKKTIAAFVGLWNFWLCPRIWLSYGPPSVFIECSTVVPHVAARG